MRPALLGALCLLTAACGAYAFPGDRPSPTPTSSMGTVSGTVLSVPCAPVEQAGTTCAGRPVPKVELSYTCEHTTVQRGLATPTDSNGRYSGQLPAGGGPPKVNTYKPCNNRAP